MFSRACPDKTSGLAGAYIKNSIAWALCALVVISGCRSAHAEDVEAMVRALQPKAKPPVTRSFNSVSRGLTIEGGAELQEEATPSIDLYVPFEYDQSNLTMSDARLTLDALGKALNDPRLKSMRFEIIGHTDARGGDDYNLVLSRKRADAVRAYLIQFPQIDGGRLVAEGRGRRELKDPSRPEDGINRRVQIRTILDKTS